MLAGLVDVVGVDSGCRATPRYSRLRPQLAAFPMPASWCGTRTPGHGSGSGPVWSARPCSPCGAAAATRGLAHGDYRGLSAADGGLEVASSLAVLCDVAGSQGGIAAHMIALAAVSVR